VNIDTPKHLASRALSLGSGSLCLAWASTAARAAEPLGAIATNIHGNLDETMKLATVVVFITGFILVGIGVFLIWRMGRHQGMHAPATLFTCLAAVLAGVLMVYHSTVVGVGGATLFGSSGGDVTIEGTVEVR
jgi:uncharacterized membrane protein YozB (DUF420 family)